MSECEGCRGCGLYADEFEKWLAEYRVLLPGPTEASVEDSRPLSDCCLSRLLAEFEIENHEAEIEVLKQRASAALERCSDDRHVRVTEVIARAMQALVLVMRYERTFAECDGVCCQTRFVEESINDA